ncbi:uncharacterized protein LOC127788611 isoform X2 [Diospyros lotus]|uniref:uncharacterized protein LOC127788611 isoform X2 n=1 Tax=Diospyros lotus TaxID=55363 RepID=UPI002250F915|nr:uncharacterized protein LOC127788611 isoform X2 [Diospyros lotus]
MECAARGRGGRCVGPATRRCARCGAVAYCSLSHQISHWSVHKDECERLEQQMDRANVLNDFPFTFSQESTVQVCEKQETRCSFLIKQGIHRAGMWMYECHCGESVASLNDSRLIESWNLPSILCPCKGPSSPLTKRLNSWGDYYEWRGIPLQSPAALLLHWPLTLYQAFQLSASRSLSCETYTRLHIHYLGPDKELTQLAVFGELQALFPEVQLHLELVGPAVPQCRDGERVDLHSYARCGDTDCSCKSSSDNLSLHAGNITPPVTLRLYKGFPSSFSYCSKCWYCCLQELVAFYCTPSIPLHINVFACVRSKMLLIRDDVLT